VGASVRNFSSVFALAGFVALVSSITAIQARLNRAWRADGSTSSHRAESLVEDRMTATRYEAPTVPRGEPRTRGRSAQDLLDRIDRERKARLELEQAR
jgi:hypothetical protein